MARAPTPYMREFFKAKEFTVLANQGRISAGPPDPILDPLEGPLTSYSLRIVCGLTLTAELLCDKAIFRFGKVGHKQK